MEKTNQKGPHVQSDCWKGELSLFEADTLGVQYNFTSLFNLVGGVSTHPGPGYGNRKPGVGQGCQ